MTLRRACLGGVLFASFAALTLTASAQEPSDAGAPTDAPRRGSLANPRATMEHFILSARDGDWDGAAEALDLSGVWEGDRGVEGPRLARRLKSVLDQELWIIFEDIPEAPEGRIVTVGRFTIGTEEVAIQLHRRRDGDGGHVWLVTPPTLRRVSEVYEATAAGPVAEALPDWMTDVRFFEMTLLQWLGVLLLLPLAYLIGVGLAALGLRVAARGVAMTKAEWDDRILASAKGPTRFLLTVTIVPALIQPLGLALPVRLALTQMAVVVGIAAGGWLAIRLVGAVAESIEAQVRDQADKDGDEIKARGVRTQVVVLRRVASIVVGTVAAAILLLQFEVVRSVGVSLLASAGIAGVVLGLAAQKSIGGLLAGIQLSITQPIRIGDTVIVEGQWGSIEEINLTYVIVKIWDERRLIVPIARFLEQPFENWTKESKELLGTVFFHADYRLPIDAVREQLDLIVEGNASWDGRFKSVLVTGVTEKTMEVRALISAKDASDQWNLRCEVREKLLAWLRDFEGGRYLPRSRFVSDAEGAEGLAEEAGAES